MKKIVSLLLVVTMLIGSIGTNLCANAKGWVEKAHEIDYDVNYDLFLDIGHPDYSSLNSYGYYYCLIIDIPLAGKIQYHIESPFESVTPQMFEIYNSNDLNEPVLSRYDSIKYSSAYGIYYVDNTINLNKGRYYFLIDVYDYSNHIECGESDGSFSIRMHYSPNLSKPSNLKCAARTTNAQKVTWNKVAGVTGYQVQCSDGGSRWAQNKVTSGNAAVFGGLVAGGKYKFRVRAYKYVNGTRYYSSWSSTLCSCAKPANVTLKSVSSPKKAQIKTTWAKAGGVVSGYQIYYGKNASFSSLAARKNVSGKSTTSYTGKNFTKGRTYYVKVRTYTVFNGVTYYGAWSATKKVKSK